MQRSSLTRLATVLSRCAATSAFDVITVTYLIASGPAAGRLRLRDLVQPTLTKLMRPLPPTHECTSSALFVSAR